MELTARKVLLYPFISEKAVNMIEQENKITFIVNDKAGKGLIKKSVEELYKVKIQRINLLRDIKGRKKAIIKLTKEFKAAELASKLGVM